MTLDKPPEPPAAELDDEAELDLDLDERAALERWQPPGPPPDFAARVLAAGVAATPAAERPPRPRWPLVVTAVAAAAALALFAWPTSGPPGPAALAPRAYAARATIALGGRGVAVVEPGAALGWRRAGAALTVHQDAGSVFYRVDRGAAAPFIVTTPAGEVRVTGTCFRVEVLPMMPSRSALLGAAAGAVFATAAVVTVYEGKVLVASPAGKATVAAGERATLDGTAPTPTAVGPGPAGPMVALAVPSEPGSAITRDELLVRDQAQRAQIAALSARLKQLEGGAVVGGPVRRNPDGPEGDHGYVDPSKDELLAMAKDCAVKIDLPPVMRGEPMQLDPGLATAVGLTAEEVGTGNQVFVELARTWKQRVRGWYIEATGDAQGADQLSAHAMGEELQDKAVPGEPEGLQARLAQERAGLVAPPADLGKLSPFERYFRAFADLGNEAERALAAKVGGDKAHRIRAENGGWPMRMSMAGCADGDGNANVDGDRDQPR